MGTDSADCCLLPGYLPRPRGSGAARGEGFGEGTTRIVSEVTGDGLVFRVDLRLRPDGTKGELANSLRSAEIYYESWGQTWERGGELVTCSGRDAAGT